MRTYYDDNFGHYEIESDDDIEFYHQVQRESRRKRCRRCRRWVRLRPDYDLCGSCADEIERGGDY